MMPTGHAPPSLGINCFILFGIFCNELTNIPFFVTQDLRKQVAPLLKGFQAEVSVLAPRWVCACAPVIIHTLSVVHDH